MSWTINQTDRNKDDIERLTAAIKVAVSRRILLFCSVSDQGVKSDGLFPANCDRGNIFQIGAATVSGKTWDWVGANDVDFIFPGTGLRVDTRNPQERSLKPISGSSLATALASGLAALILYCVGLNNPQELELVRTYTTMKQAFHTISKDGDKSKYIPVWDLFDKAKEEGPTKTSQCILQEVVSTLLSHARR